MPLIALKGLKGGAGTTSIASGLAWALYELGESILLIDFSPDNVLRLHFNMQFIDKTGWARSYIDGTPWQNSAMMYTENFYFLPYGQLSNNENTQLQLRLAKDVKFWPKNLNKIKNSEQYKWIILDLPSEINSLNQTISELVDHNLIILTADAMNYTLLMQKEFPKKSFFLLNKYDPSKMLQQDIHLLWQYNLNNLSPVNIHNSESIPESLALKKPVSGNIQQTQTEKEMLELAGWCKLNLSGMRLEDNA